MKTTATAVVLEKPALPDAPGPRAAVVQRRLQLAELRALLHAGRYARGRELAAPLVEQARGLGFRPLTAEAELLHGAFLCRDGHPSDGAAALADAVWTATAARHDLAVVDLVRPQQVAHQCGRAAEARRRGVAPRLR